MNAKLLKRLVVHGKAVARTARHFPCPLASASGNFRLDICPRRVCARETRRVAASSRPVPKFQRRRGEAFIFLSEEESSVPRLAALALARARKLQRVWIGQCRSGRIQNNEILLESDHFNKVIVAVTSRNKPNEFNGLYCTVTADFPSRNVVRRTLKSCGNSSDLSFLRRRNEAKFS
jgi:hypothetical protein